MATVQGGVKNLRARVERLIADAYKLQQPNGTENRLSPSELRKIHSTYTQVETGNEGVINNISKDELLKLYLVINHPQSTDALNFANLIKSRLDGPNSKTNEQVAKEIQIKYAAVVFKRIKDLAQSTEVEQPRLSSDDESNPSSSTSMVHSSSGDSVTTTGSVSQQDSSGVTNPSDGGLAPRRLRTVTRATVEDLFDNAASYLEESPEVKKSPVHVHSAAWSALMRSVEDDGAVVSGARPRSPVAEEQQNLDPAAAMLRAMHTTTPVTSTSRQASDDESAAAERRQRHPGKLPGRSYVENESQRRVKGQRGRGCFGCVSN